MKLTSSLIIVVTIALGGCVTASIENDRAETTGLREGETVVVMAKSYHLGNETEANFISCIGDSIGRGSTGLRVIPNREFVDALFPWFEPRTAPCGNQGLTSTYGATRALPKPYGKRVFAISSGWTATRIK